MQAQPGRTERIRHHRKYAEGNLRWHSFYFRGPDNHLNLKAQNLTVFCQIDESTWMYHEFPTCDHPLDNRAPQHGWGFGT